MKFKETIQSVLKSAGLPIFLVFFGLISYGLYFNISRSLEYEKWTIHTHEVMTQINDTQSKMYDADSIYIRYAIFKEERYLELYRQDIIDSDTARARLKQLTIDNPNQQANLQTLEDTIISRRQIRNQMANADLKTLQSFVVTHENNNIKKNIGGLFKIMIDEEQRLLVERESKFHSSIAMVVVLISMFAVMLAGAFGFIAGEMHAQKNILSDFLSGAK